MFLPIHTAWWAVFGVSLDWLLLHIYHAISSVPFLELIGAYGLAIIVMTILVKAVLFPLYHLQLVLSKRNLQNQRRVAPQLAEVRKKYKGEPQKQQAATMELYRQEGVNPLGGLSGCLPSLVQMPILIALYYVFSGNAHKIGTAHFLFVPNLNVTPFSQPLIHGLPIPGIAYLVIPLLAAATTFVQSRMMQQPPNPAASEQEQQAQAMTKQMQVFMPLMILYFAFVTPAGLGLYWFISNCFAIIQQYLVNGWGGLFRRPQAAAAVAGAAPTPPAERSRSSAPPPRPVRQAPPPRRGVNERKRPRPRKPKR
ncbi:MAG: YidC/Oxa1 family membrane protein insertase [Candidatus Dormibacteraeota bacterium]|nr:YidC/Oxa1 family membrane protein insertase [Candidatus Dormibacteraeota bacterium]